MKKSIILLLFVAIVFGGCATVIKEKLESTKNLEYSNKNKGEIYVAAQEWAFEKVDNVDKNNAVEIKFTDKDSGKILVTFDSIIKSRVASSLKAQYKITLTISDNKISAKSLFLGTVEFQEQSVGKRVARALMGAAANNDQGDKIYPDAIAPGFGIKKENIQAKSDEILDELETFLNENL